MTGEKDAPAEMPGVEEIARLVCREVNPVQFDDLPEAASYLERKTHFDRPILDKTEGRDIARAILDLFAPILAEKERQLTSFRQYVAMHRDRALAAEAERDAAIKTAEMNATSGAFWAERGKNAEAALAAERERAERTIAARDRRIARLVWAMDYARSKGVAFPADTEPKVVLSDAAAIRAQGE